LVHFSEGLSTLRIESLELPARPAVALAAVARLPALTSLGLSLSPGRDDAQLRGLGFPSGLTSLRLHGAGADALEAAARLPRLAALAAFASPAFSADGGISLPTIAPLASAAASLCSLTVEWSPSWGEASYDALAGLTSLEHADLRGFSPRALRALGSLPSLARLELSLDYGELDDPMADELGPLTVPPVLETLELEVMHGSAGQVGRLLRVLSPLSPALRVAELTNCQLDDAAAASLGTFSALRCLHLEGCDAPETLLARLAPLRSLALLELGSVRLSEEGLRHLASARLPALVRLGGLTLDPHRCDPDCLASAVSDAVDTLPLLRHLQVRLCCEALIADPDDPLTAAFAERLAAHTARRYPHVHLELSASP